MVQPSATGEPPSAVRIALADDHPAMLTGWRTTIDNIPGCEVVLEAMTGKQFIDGLGAALPVHIAMLDLSMPVMDGLEAIRWTRERYPDIRLLATSFDDSDATILRTLRAGANGFITKAAMPQEYADAVDQLLRTGFYYTARVHTLLVRVEDGLTEEERARVHAFDSISAREWEVMEVLARDDEPSSKAAAGILGLSTRTVESHSRNVCAKVDRKTRMGALLYLVRAGLLK